MLITGFASLARWLAVAPWRMAAAALRRLGRPRRPHP
jgi:hypothetical protein